MKFSDFKETPCNECGGCGMTEDSNFLKVSKITDSFVDHIDERKCPACKGKGSTRQATEITPLKVPDGYDYCGIIKKRKKQYAYFIEDTYSNAPREIEIKLPHKIGATETFTCDCGNGYLATHRLEHVKCPHCQGNPEITAQVTDMSVEGKTLTAKWEEA